MLSVCFSSTVLGGNGKAVKGTQGKCPKPSNVIIPSFYLNKTPVSLAKKEWW
jgi:hypothetical protein